jgi:trehalose 6-phosphate synthase/phosphatase
VAAARVSELRDALMELSGNLGLTIQDTQKRLEIRSAGVSKGRGAAVWLEREEWGLILAAGDDASDEAIFEALPDRAFSFKVGLEMSRARYFVDSEAAVRALLARLASLRDSSKEG